MNDLAAALLISRTLNRTLTLAQAEALAALRATLEAAAQEQARQQAELTEQQRIRSTEAWASEREVPRAGVGQGLGQVGARALALASLQGPSATHASCSGASDSPCAT